MPRALIAELGGRAPGSPRSGVGRDPIAGGRARRRRREAPRTQPRRERRPLGEQLGEPARPSAALGVPEVLERDGESSPSPTSCSAPVQGRACRPARRARVEAGIARPSSSVGGGLSRRSPASDPRGVAECLGDPEASAAPRRTGGSSRASRIAPRRGGRAAAEEALVQERLERRQIGVAHGLGGLEGAACREDGQPGEERLFGGPEEVVGPLDRGAERRVALVGVAGPPRQVEPVAQRLERRVRSEQLRSRGGELDGQREPVEPTAKSWNGVSSAQGRAERRARASMKSSIASSSASGGRSSSRSPWIRSPSRLVTRRRSVWRLEDPRAMTRAAAPAEGARHCRARRGCGVRSGCDRRLARGGGSSAWATEARMSPRPEAAPAARRRCRRLPRRPAAGRARSRIASSRCRPARGLSARAGRGRRRARRRRRARARGPGTASLARKLDAARGPDRRERRRRPAERSGPSPRSP